MDDYECSGFLFKSNFDSGNLGRVEFVRKNEDSNKLDTLIVKEFNLYTRPDCGGTVYENGNRTWFFFGVRGGEPHQMVKFNVMNLNRQAKLYSQGMHPVIRIGLHGKWERIKDKPTYSVENENFVLNFIHRVPENLDLTVFYAFTYPYTCSDLSDFLDKLDKKYALNASHVKNIITFINNSNNDDNKLRNEKNFVINKKKEETFTDGSSDEKTQIEICDESDLSSTSEISEKTEEIGTVKTESTASVISTIENTVKYQNIELNLKVFDNNNVTVVDKKDSKTSKLSTTFGREYRSNHNFNNNIYYYRENLVYSLQGRRVELITITSFSGITEEREPMLSHLFPDAKFKRCHIFKNKKVIFLSSRVHPGETPASFVLHGFINFILDKKDIVAATLRNMYIFKIVPFLNPDGVFNGMYRSDTLGQNLNRVYLSPKLETQPTIYAAKKLISYYHYGHDKLEKCEQLIDKLEEPIQNVSKENINSKENIVENLDEVTPDLENIKCYEENLSKESSATTSSSSDDIQLCSTDELMNQTIDSEVEIMTTPSFVCMETNDETLNFNTKPKSKEKLQQSTSTGLNIAVALKPSTSNKINSNNEIRMKTFGTSTSSDASRSSKTNLKKNNLKKESKNIRPRSPMHPILGQYQRGNRSIATTNKNLSSTFQLKCTESDDKNYDEKSNLFLYIDLHGHASKKGVFMYGNHLPNIAEAVECMLLPRLMSMNCHHFHFDACNFSERNMYLKGKRDGLSKEGSGRVAVYKAIGLIKSYTLESNYNTGKIVNLLPPRGKDTSVKIINLMPPKYSPSIFEEVGRALGPSILDLTNSNPISRLGNSEFRTLQGLRNALKQEIDKNITRNIIAAKASRPKLRRMKNSFSRTSSTQVDALKENKALYDMPWELIPSGSNNNNTNIAVLSQQPTTSTTTSRPMSSTTLTTSTTISTASTAKLLHTTTKLPKKSLAKNQTIFGKKENSSSNSKKIKIYCDPTTTGATGSSSSSIVTKNLQTIKVITDPSQVQVPRKRIKVSSTQIQLSNKILNENELSPGRETLNYGSSTSLKGFFQTTETTNIIETSNKSISNNQLPCCSSSLKINLKSSNQPNITNPSTMKNLTKTTKNKLRKSNSLPNLSKKILSDGTKLKKKRIIKTETGLKRKKTRVKTVWH